MLFSEYKKAFSKETVGRYDITPIFSDIQLFNSLINDLIAPFENEIIDKIVCLDALGFILGSVISIKMNKGLILARKEGKLPLKSNELVKKTFIDYSYNQKSFEMNKNMIKKNENMLLVDDWIETGEQVKAVISILEEANANIAGITVIGADRNEKTEVLFRSYNLHSIGING